jgi:hypothetical protein
MSKQQITAEALAQAEAAGLPSEISQYLAEVRFSPLMGITVFLTLAILLGFIFSGFFYFEIADRYLPLLSRELHLKEETWIFFRSTTEINLIAYVFASIGLGSIVGGYSFRLFSSVERYNGFSTIKRMLQLGDVDQVVSLIDQELLLRDSSAAGDLLLIRVSRHTMRVLNWFAYVLVPPYFIFLALDMSNYQILTDREFRASGYFSPVEKRAPLTSAQQVRTGCRLFDDGEELSLKYVVDYGEAGEINLFEAQPNGPLLETIAAMDQKLTDAGVPFRPEALSGMKTGEKFTNLGCFERLAFRYERQERATILSLLRLESEYQTWRKGVDTNNF